MAIRDLRVIVSAQVIDGFVIRISRRKKIQPSNVVVGCVEDMMVAGLAEGLWLAQTFLEQVQ